MRKERNKPNTLSLAKIRARFDMKCEEFAKLPLYDELEEDGVTVKLRGLRTIFREDKMSSTDKQALVASVNFRMQQQMAEISKQVSEDEIEPIEDDKTEGTE